jgi:hypothetical protein
MKRRKKETRKREGERETCSDRVRVVLADDGAICVDDPDAGIDGALAGD